MRPPRISKKQLINQLNLKYFMKQAGNDSPQLKKEIDSILAQLEKVLIE